MQQSEERAIHDGALLSTAAVCRGQPPPAATPPKTVFHLCLRLLLASTAAATMQLLGTKRFGMFEPSSGKSTGLKAFRELRECEQSAAFMIDPRQHQP